VRPCAAREAVRNLGWQGGQADLSDIAQRAKAEACPPKHKANEFAARSKTPRSLVGIVPNIGREFPVISDFFPNHNILPAHFLWPRALRLQAESADLACR